MSRVLNDSENRITSPYGWRNGRLHGGVDLSWRNNEEENIVYANSEGVVTNAVTGRVNKPDATGDYSWGNYVIVRHDNGYYTVYAHLKEVYVHVGERVDSNTKIGLEGDTGAALGRHLHFEVRDPNYNRIDPTPYLTQSVNDIPVRGVVSEFQEYLNRTYGYSLAIDNSFGPDTKKHAIMALQTEMNKQYGSGLSVDGSFGPATKKACEGHDLYLGCMGNITKLVQYMLLIKGYSLGDAGADGSYGYVTENAIKKFQGNNNLKVDGYCGPNTFERLFG